MTKLHALPTLAELGAADVKKILDVAADLEQTAANLRRHAQVLRRHAMALQAASRARSRARGARLSRASH